MPVSKMRAGRHLPVSDFASKILFQLRQIHKLLEMGLQNAYSAKITSKKEISRKLAPGGRFKPPFKFRAVQPM